MASVGHKNILCPPQMISYYSPSTEEHGNSEKVTTSFPSADNMLKKLEMCSFFDDIVKPDIFFLTVHDAVLYIEHRQQFKSGHDPLLEKVRQAWTGERL